MPKDFRITALYAGSVKMLPSGLDHSSGK